MAIDIDEFPINDAIVKSEKGQPTNQMAQVWTSSLSTLTDTLKGYLSQNGIFAPQLTTAQRDAIKTAAVNGQLIYNTTTNKFQGFEAGVWKDLI